ncbi:ABC transporter ATP-binding protein [Pseudomonas ficuserectae]|uniref:ABC transporter ATP-binding protein n=2 Tax=Pseudomonas amygdali pv. lachrymans TaxID=53707 RepID=A0AB37QZJ2_PSEAV|nr:ABC transporter ATP-binding protein [Pseudomonas amygdali]ARA79241.1 ABC transporter [Pseudomonas amygdali pv. lachrymans]AXH58139.1 ABC transporter ATP-binding protein [Pseudomonas amygdali pv. lachrymans str. M301315]KKY59867.1 ABC transporter [Pseudomonas amygdali pv. lachrymans]KPC04730.1 ABC transporter ATP-binding protein [Pseudomonas amygdali pv. lachrymans]KPC15676.1 ABC transporter ATP-binding protein [Pseudomonas amygdali pv. lachrymans]
MSNHAIPARLQLRHITKRYPGCLANDAVDLTIQPGEIHALLGENGAGKSTLMKIIYGVTQPDAGSIIWQGQVQTMRNPAQARSLGIGMVFQHFSLFETLSVAQNIALAMGAAAGTPKQLEPRIREVSQRYGMAVEPQRLVHSLSIGERQKVEIIRCLMQDIRLLILDEPTSVLTPQEAEELFVTLRHLAAEGCSILFISHKLGEVRALCHSATVLRNGKVSGHCIPAECSDLELSRLMVGDAEGLTAHYDKVSGSEAFLRIDKLSWHNPDPFGCSLKDLSLEVRSGEIVGIAGVAGNGQDELLALLSGEQTLPHAQATTLRFQDTPVGDLRPDARRKRGLAFVPAERLGHGAVPELSLADNALLTAFQQGLVSNGLIQRGKVRALADEIIRRFAVKTPDAQAAARSLSGGNLQKFILGREILQNPKLLIAAHPTWGVDVGAAAAIHRALIALRDAGAAILVISEDLDELFQISDRLAALSGGQLSDLIPTEQTSTVQIGGWMAGQFDHSHTQAHTAG